ncbi:MAG: sporulation protein [Candidatus Bathyarchaeota archaeon]|nr:MAG: sporulation protein [Candidatus Bathyarchaeota archaeon]
MGIFGKFKKPKGKIEVQLDRAAYEATDRFTGRIVVAAEEEMPVDEFRVEIRGDSKTEWKQKGRWGSSSLNISSTLGTESIPLAGPMKLSKGQRYEQRFQVDIPKHTRPDPFTEIEMKVKGVVAINGRLDLTHEVKPQVNLPYVMECPRKYGGCGFTTQPIMEPIDTCPKCGYKLEEGTNRKYEDRLKESD